MGAEGAMESLWMPRSYRMDAGPCRCVVGSLGGEGPGCLSKAGAGRGSSPVSPVGAHLTQPETMGRRPPLTSGELLMMVCNGRAWEEMTSLRPRPMTGG